MRWKLKGRVITVLLFLFARGTITSFTTTAATASTASISTKIVCKWRVFIDTLVEESAEMFLETPILWWFKTLTSFGLMYWAFNDTFNDLKRKALPRDPRTSAGWSKVRESLILSIHRRYTSYWSRKGQKYAQ